MCVCMSIVCMCVYCTVYVLVMLCTAYSSVVVLIILQSFLSTEEKEKCKLNSVRCW